MNDDTRDTPVHFIKKRITDDVARGRTRVITRFPPEPNGLLHIGHAKSICLNFGLAREFAGRCHLRFDDTNPSKEEETYVASIQEDVRWLGFDWGDHLYFASDYFAQLYQFATRLIELGKAYVCELTPDQIRQHRGTLTEPGRESPWRDRAVAENLDLFQRMRAGEFPDGAMVLRAKIDMASGNLNMRDPVIYRIMRARHHRTGDQWCIYPMYDFAHCLSDAIEGITHSICTLEFEDHRPLYDWFLDVLATPCHPQQIEFARLNITHTVMSKRKLLLLVQKGVVSGWDDPRMPTISGMRRRGYPPAAIREFCDRIGVAKKDSTVDMALLEFCVREELNRTAPRFMAVLDPIKVVLDNFPEDLVEEMEGINNPEDPAAGTRKIPFSRELYIEREDFMEEPPKNFFRLGPGREVRLRYGYYITCRQVVKNDAGEIVELRCSYDPQTRGGQAPDGRKVKGTIHWVAAASALPMTVRLFDHLFAEENPEESGDGNFLDRVNPDSLRIAEQALAEPALAGLAPGVTCQFERLGYFCKDAPASVTGCLVVNRTATLRDTWKKVRKKN